MNLRSADKIDLKNVLVIIVVLKSALKKHHFIYLDWDCFSKRSIMQ